MIIGGLSTFVISVIAPSHRCIAYAHTVWHEATEFDTLTHLREKKLLGVGCAAQPRALENRFFKILLLCMLMLFNRAFTFCCRHLSQTEKSPTKCRQVWTAVNVHASCPFDLPRPFFFLGIWSKFLRLSDCAFWWQPAGVFILFTARRYALARSLLSPSVCSSVTFVCCIHTTEDITKLLSRPSNAIILVFWFAGAQFQGEPVQRGRKILGWWGIFFAIFDWNQRLSRKRYERGWAHLPAADLTRVMTWCPTLGFATGCQ